MSRCKYCNKRIKWIEVAEDTPRGPVLKRIPVDPKSRPRKRHDCRPSDSPAPDRPREVTDDEPWWVK